MKTVSVGEHQVHAPDRKDLPEAKTLFIELIGQWTKLLFSTGDLVASDEGWDRLTKLLALFPISETRAIAPLADIANDLERIERLFLSGKALDPDSFGYGSSEDGGLIVPVPTEKMFQNFATPALLDLAGYQLWHVLPEALRQADVGAKKQAKAKTTTKTKAQKK